MGLALDNHGVQRLSAIIDRGVADEGKRAGCRIDLHLGEVAAVWEGEGSLRGRLGIEIFGDFAAFKGKIKEAGLGRFGSGWAWLVLHNGKLEVVSTSNQDSPYMSGQTPILGVDVWEHAYYLRYQNRRADYLEAWWKVVNWNEIAKRFAAAQSGK